MNEEVAGTITDTRPPLIGKCPKCQAEIRASHPYAWCVRCNEPLPYDINMQRRLGCEPFEQRRQIVRLRQTIADEQN